MEGKSFLSSFLQTDLEDLIFPDSYHRMLARPLGEDDLLTKFLEQSAHALGEEGEELRHLENKGQDAKLHGDWESAVSAYEQFLKVVSKKHAKSYLPEESRVFLTFFAGIPLADLYHLKLDNLPATFKALQRMHEVLNLRTVDGRILSDSDVYSDLLSALKFRHSLVLFERERCNSPTEHASSRKETIHKAVGYSDFTDMKHRHMLQDSWFCDMRTCVSLHWLWMNEGKTENSLYWLQLCKILQKEFKDIFCRTPAEFEVTYFSVQNAEQFFVVEVRTTINEAFGYLLMGKARESIELLLRLKSEIYETTWISDKVQATCCLLLEVNQNLRTAYMSALQDQGYSFDWTNGLQAVEQEMLQIGGCLDSKGVENFDIKMMKIKANSLYYRNRVEEALGIYERCLQLVKQTSMPHNLYLKHAWDCSIQLGLGQLFLHGREKNRLEHLANACKYLDEALQLAYEEANSEHILNALSGLGSAFLTIFRDRLGSDESSEIPDYSGLWLASSQGPFSSTNWSEYHSKELQMAEKLCRLQIEKQAEILYHVKDHHDDWLYVTNRWNRSSVYLDLQAACALIITGLTDLAHFHRKRGDYDEQLQGVLRSQVREKLIQSLLWSERGRARTLVYQLGPKYLCPEAGHSLMQFDMDDQVAWDAIQDGRLACGERAVCVEYCYGVQDGHEHMLGIVYVYVVYPGPKGSQIRSLMITGADTLNLEDLLERFHSIMSNIVNFDEMEVMDILEGLYDCLVVPIADLLPPQDGIPQHKLIFAPHGLLANVPFSLLRNRKTKHFIFEDHIISLAPSLRVLGLCNKRFVFLKGLQLAEDRMPVIVVGDPSYSQGQHRLKGSGTEADNIEALFGKDHVTNLQGSAATVKSVLELVEQSSKSNRSQACVHFAVHGHVSQEFPKGALELSDTSSSMSNFAVEAGSTSITSDLPHGRDTCEKHLHQPMPLKSQLTESEETHDVFCEVGSASKIRSGNMNTYVLKDNYLRSQDIIMSGVDWRAYLVVLSACDTSRGQVFAEGVLNLPRAFMVAGVPCIVMSQWRIDDASTSELMKEFYINLRKQEMDVSSSLRMAMLKMMHDGLEIYKWGAFAVWGLPTVCLPSELTERIS